MGLDNGVMLKDNGKHKLIFSKLFTHENWYKENEYEVIYMRKWWGVRNEILYVIHCKEQNDSETPLTVQNIKDIIKVLKSWNRVRWIEEGGSIWDWDEDKIKKQIRCNIMQLRKLLMIMRLFKGVECYFYDSY